MPKRSGKRARRAGARRVPAARADKKVAAAGERWAVVRYRDGGFAAEQFVDGHDAAEAAIAAANERDRGAPGFRARFAVCAEDARPGARQAAWLLRRDEGGQRRYRMLMRRPGEPAGAPGGWQALELGVHTVAPAPAPEPAAPAT